MDSENHCGQPIVKSQRLAKNLPCVAVPLKVVAPDVNVKRVDFLAPICANVIVRFKKMLTTIFCFVNLAC